MKNDLNMAVASKVATLMGSEVPVVEETEVAKVVASFFVMAVIMASLGSSVEATVMGCSLDPAAVEAEGVKVLASIFVMTLSVAPSVVEAEEVKAVTSSFVMASFVVPSVVEAEEVKVVALIVASLVFAGVAAVIFEVLASVVAAEVASLVFAGVTTVLVEVLALEVAAEVAKVFGLVVGS